MSVRQSVCVGVLTLVLSVFSFEMAQAASPPRFQRGDADSSGSVNVADAIRIFLFLFAGDGSLPLPCLDAADADNSGDITLTDGIRILTFLFGHTRSLPPPFHKCGTDPSTDALGCASYTGCPGVRRELLDDAEVVIFVIDRSGTMFDSGEIQIARREVLDAISNFPESGELGVFFFDASLTGLPSSGPPLPASPDNKTSLVRFVDQMPGGHATCQQPALEAAFNMLARSNRGRKAIIYLSDGGGTCPGQDEAIYLRDTLKAVKALNTSNVTVHAAEVGEQGSGTLNQKYLRDLAEQNGGKFLQIKT